MKHFFLDTNVVLDFLLERDPFAGPVGVLVELGRRKQVQLSVSSLSFTTIYYVMSRQRIGGQQIIAALKDIANVTIVASVSSEIVQRALQAGYPDFEDAVQIFTALAIQADVIITRDHKGFVQSLIAVADPVGALAQLSE